MRGKYFAAFLGLFLLYLQGATVFAHGVSLFAWVEGDTVFVESKFSGGRTPKAARIEVYDPQGKKLLEGVTNENGEFNFKAPQQTDLNLVLLAGMGHRAEWKISREELAQVNPAAASSPDPEKLPQSDSKAPETGGRTDASPRGVPAGHGISATEIESIVERVLEKQLSPIRRQLAETRSGHYSVKDIVGGLGYILGLVGVAAYMSRRRK